MRYYVVPKCEIILISKTVLKKNMNVAIARYEKRYENGNCTSNELQTLIALERKNYEHYGIPYIKNLDKALTPKRGW